MSGNSSRLPIIGKTENVSAEGARGSWHEKCHCHEENHCHDHCHDECHDECHDDCDSMQSVVQRTANCFRELRRLALEVFRCIGCGPSDSRMMTILTCLILEDINSIFKEIVELKNHMCCMSHREATVVAPDEKSCFNVTSGMIFVTNDQSDKVRVAVANNTKASQTVRVRILNCDVNPHAVLNELSLRVDSRCSRIISQSIGGAFGYEIQVFDLVPGMTVSSVEETISGSLIDGTKLAATAFVPNVDL